jgi:hypothetical protein
MFFSKNRLSDTVILEIRLPYFTADEYMAGGIPYPSNFFFFFARPVALYCEVYIYIYTHTPDCVKIVCELPLLQNNAASATFLHQSGPVRSVDWIFIIGAPAWRWLGE